VYICVSVYVSLCMYMCVYVSLSQCEPRGRLSITGRTSRVHGLGNGDFMGVRQGDSLWVDCDGVGLELS